MTELDEFRSYLQYDCRKSPNTVASYSSDVKSFLEWLSEQGRDATEAESADFEVYVKEHGFVSPRSQSRALSAIRSFYAWMRREGRIARDPSERIDMPKLNIIDDPQLNAFASGIDRDSYTVTVTTGLLRILNDDELAGVIAHELTHIRNRDTRLLITSIIFVGIISTVMGIVYDIFMRMLLFGGGTRNDSDEDNRGGASTLVVMVVAMICSAIAYLFIILTRFAISRKREFMADAGGAEICGNPLALASALRKISAAPGLGGTEREDIAQLFIVHPKMSLTGLSQFVSRLFATHPDTAERIRLLEQF